MSEKPPVPIKYTKLDVAVYANELIVQVDQDALYLHFCQLQPPLNVPGLPREESVSSVPLTSVAIPRSRAQAFIEVMQSQLEEIQELLTNKAKAEEVTK
ncbi:MAG: hypothetical protein U0903_00135 [Planctomycetales bacterium]